MFPAPRIYVLLIEIVQVLLKNKNKSSFFLLEINKNTKQNAWRGSLIKTTFVFGDFRQDGSDLRLHRPSGSGHTGKYIK